MKKVILIAVSIALVLSFQTPIEAAKAKFYQIAFLETIERAPTVTVEKKFDAPNVYKDEVISIEWNPRPNGLGFELTNNTSNSMSVIWDQCAFVDQKGQTHKTMHAGVKYIDRNNAMPPSLVPANGKISDLLYPSDYVYYS
ncbi:MAG: hypothetical protein GTN87_09890, partial [Hydrotalea flava]|nr:hypothetical protein [Hydrotalea flava]